MYFIEQLKIIFERCFLVKEVEFGRDWSDSWYQEPINWSVFKLDNKTSREEVKEMKKVTKEREIAEKIIKNQTQKEILAMKNDFYLKNKELLSKPERKKILWNNPLKKFREGLKKYKEGIKVGTGPEFWDDDMLLLMDYQRNNPFNTDFNWLAWIKTIKQMERDWLFLDNSNSHEEYKNQAVQEISTQELTGVANIPEKIDQRYVDTIQRSVQNSTLISSLEVQSLANKISPNDKLPQIVTKMRDKIIPSWKLVEMIKIPNIKWAIEKCWIRNLDLISDEGYSITSFRNRLTDLFQTRFWITVRLWNGDNSVIRDYLALVAYQKIYWIRVDGMFSIPTKNAMNGKIEPKNLSSIPSELNYLRSGGVWKKVIQDSQKTQNRIQGETPFQDWISQVSTSQSSQFSEIHQENTTSTSPSPTDKKYISSDTLILLNSISRKNDFGGNLWNIKKIIENWDLLKVIDEDNIKFFIEEQSWVKVNFGKMTWEFSLYNVRKKLEIELDIKLPKNISFWVPDYIALVAYQKIYWITADGILSSVTQDAIRWNRVKEGEENPIELSYFKKAYIPPKKRHQQDFKPKTTSHIFQTSLLQQQLKKVAPLRYTTTIRPLQENHQKLPIRPNQRTFQPSQPEKEIPMLKFQAPEIRDFPEISTPEYQIFEKVTPALSPIETKIKELADKKWIKIENLPMFKNQWNISRVLLAKLKTTLSKVKNDLSTYFQNNPETKNLYIKFSSGDNYNEDDLNAVVLFQLLEGLGVDWIIWGKVKGRVELKNNEEKGGGKSSFRIHQQKKINLVRLFQSLETLYSLEVDTTLEIIQCELKITQKQSQTIRISWIFKK